MVSSGKFPGELLEMELGNSEKLPLRGEGERRTWEGLERRMDGTGSSRGR